MDAGKSMSFPGSKEGKLEGSEETTPLLRANSSIDEALDRVGLGFFHVILIIVTGWALASDSVHIGGSVFYTKNCMGNLRIILIL